VHPVSEASKDPLLHITVSGNIIKNNTANIGIILGRYSSEVYQTLTNIIIEENDISDNDKGILVRSGADGVIIRNNDIYDNTTIGVENTHTEDLNAKFNWWGNTSGPGGEGPGTGDDVSAHVLYAPWLGALQGTEPPAGEPKFYVDETGDIQDAIDAAVAGDIIEIGDGVFNQTITVNKANLTIKNGSEPIFDGGGAGIGFDVLANDFTLEGVTVRNFLSGIRVAIGVTGTTINECKIYSNTNYGVENLGTEAVDATLNWWGHLSGPFHSSNTCGSGNAVTDNVTYSPWYNSVLMNSTTVLDLTPSTQARFVGFTGVTDDAMTIAWLSGNGVQRLVVIREDDSFGDADTELDANGINVSGVDGSWGNKVAIPNTTDSYVIAVTSNNYVTITGLDPETTYWIKIYEFGCLASGVAQNIYTPNATMNPRSRKTAPASPPAIAGATNLTDVSFYANWTGGGTLGDDDYFEVQFMLPTGDPLDENDWVNGTYTTLYDVGNTLTFPFFDLTDDSEYHYRVRLIKNNTVSAWTAYQSVTTFHNTMALYW